MADLMAFLRDLLKTLRYLLRWGFVSVLVALMAGSAAALFLHALAWVTITREAHRWLLLGLPVCGVAMAWLYRRYGEALDAGNNLIIEEIHDPKAVVPLRLAPLILISTLATHLFGGSAGREGTAVQMGGSLADQLTRFLPFSPEDRRVVLIAGIAAGFGAVFGTPLAGAVFGLEVLALGRLRTQAVLPAFLSAWLAHVVALRLGVRHESFFVFSFPLPTPLVIAQVLAAGALFGLVARLFSWAMHATSALFVRRMSNPLLRPAVAGVALLALFVPLFGTRYLGLSLPLMADSFEKTLPLRDAALKFFATVLTLGGGFKGGEVTPLFCIGASFGSALSAWFTAVPRPLLAGMGFVAVFAGAANTPFACTLMAAELFGGPAAVFCGAACVMSYVFSGHAGIYRSQRVDVRKDDHASA